MSSLAPKTLLPVQVLNTITQALSRSSSSSSILPFIPRSVRWILVLVALFNYRAFPGVWHMRVFSNIAAIRLRGLFKWSNHERRREFVNRLSPVGENPFDICVTYTTTAGFSDTDYNGHLSNSSYAKNLDHARMRAAVAFFPSILEAKGWLGLGASHFYFVKEIPFMAKYEIRIHIGGWDSKWLNMIVQFVTYPEGKKKNRQGKGTGSASTGQSTPTRTSAMDEDEQVESPLTYTPPTRLPSSSVSHTRSKSSPHHQAPTSHSRPPARSQPLSRPRSASDSSLLSHSSRSSYATATEGLSRIDDDEEEYDDYDQGRGDREEEEDESYSSGSSTAASSPPSSSPNKLSSPLPSSSSSNAAPPPSPATAADLSQIQDAMPPLPEGAVLHCIHVSSYCFKHGRITIPPRVALVVCGFGDARDGPKTKWERVQEIRNTRKWPIPEGLVAPESPRPGGDAASRRPREFEHGGLRAILRGGWKAYEKEGLWDLPVYEEQRVKAVEAFGTLRNHMASLNSTTAACSTSGMMPEVQAGLSVGATTA